MRTPAGTAPRLVASDVDGTLLDPRESVTPRTAAVVARVLAAGVPFVLASGRPPRWIPSVAMTAGVTGHAVCSNGAVLYDIAADAVLATHELTPMLLRDVTHALSAALPGCAYAAERVGATAHELGTEGFLTEHEYEHPWPDDRIRSVPLGELIGRSATKLLVRHQGMNSDDLAEAATAVLGDAVDITFSSSVGMLELSAPGVTKGTGLAEVAERYGVAAEDVIAFGDMPNDIPMLRWAGLGVAMGNAHPDAAAAADEVTLTNAKEGLAVVLERWF